MVDLKGFDVNMTPSWWKFFQSRHPDLVLHKTLTHQRINGASVPIFKNYFNVLEVTLDRG